MQEGEYFGALKLLIWLKGALGISKTYYGMLYSGWLDCIQLPPWWPIQCCGLDLWQTEHRSFDYCSQSKVFSFIHPPGAFITEQPEKLDQVLAVQVYVGAVSGGTGALQGTVFSLRSSVCKLCWQSGCADRNVWHWLDLGTWSHISLMPGRLGPERLTWALKSTRQRLQWLKVRALNWSTPTRRHYRTSENLAVQLFTLMSSVLLGILEMGHHPFTVFSHEPDVISLFRYLWQIIQSPFWPVQQVPLSFSWCGN